MLAQSGFTMIFEKRLVFLIATGGTSTSVDRAVTRAIPRRCGVAPLTPWRRAEAPEAFSKSVLMRTLVAGLSGQCLLTADASSVTINWSPQARGRQASILTDITASTSTTRVSSGAKIILYDCTLDVRSYQLPARNPSVIVWTGKRTTKTCFQAKGKLYET